MQLTYALYDLGLAIHNQVKAIGNVTRAAQLEQVLLELIGKTQLIGFINPSVLINPADISALFPTTNLPPTAYLISVIQARGDAQLVNTAIAANSATNNFYKAESKNVQNTSNVATGSTQGFSSVETFAMLLTRRIKWGDNFKDCKGEQAVGLGSVSQDMGTVASFDKTSSVEDSDTWRENRDNLAYLQTRLGDKLKGATIADIRSAMNTYITIESNNNTINKSDTHITSQLSKINTSNDIKEVTSVSVSLLKSIPTATKVTSSSTHLYSELGTDRGAGMYAAQNRNFIEQQGGKKQPSGLTS
jgi:hypothetical protein